MYIQVYKRVEEQTLSSLARYKQCQMTYTKKVTAWLKVKILYFYLDGVILGDLNVLSAVQGIGVCRWITGWIHISRWRNVIAATAWWKKGLIDLLPMYVTKFKSQTHERKNDNKNTKQKFNSMDSSTTVNHDHL